jgi:ribosome-associated toxin RatA of RatAB toxin-antitoxin module
MPRIEESIAIDRAPEDVFAYVTDVGNDAIWQSGVEESRWLDEDEIRVGRRAEQVSRFLGKRLRFVTEVTAWDPPKQASVKTVEGPFSYEGTYRCEPEGDGCVFTIFGETPGMGGFFGKLADPLVIKMYARQFRSDMGTLKDLLEHEAEQDL